MTLEERANWEKLAQKVLDLSSWKRENSHVPIAELECRAAEIEQHTPGWYLQWNGQEYCLLPNVVFSEEITHDDLVFP